MKSVFLGTVLVISFACTRDLDVAPESPANPSATEQPLSSSVGALREGFDPETVAPKTTAAAAGHEQHQGDHGATPAATQYTCPHHPEVVSDKAGKCPKCGMDLVPKKTESKQAATTYTCSHHPEVVSDKPGKCPKCGMDLVPKKDTKAADPKGGHDHGAHP